MIQRSESRKEELDCKQSCRSPGTQGWLRSRTLSKCPHLEPRFLVKVAMGPAVHEASVCQDNSPNRRPRKYPWRPRQE